MIYVVPQSSKVHALLVFQQSMDVFGVTSEEKTNAFGEHVMLTEGNRDKGDLVQVSGISFKFLNVKKLMIQVL